MTTNDIYRSALRKLGVQNPTPAEITAAQEALNVIMQDIQNTGTVLWKKSEALMPLVANQVSYLLDPLLIEIEADDWFFRQEGNDTQVKPMTRSDYAAYGTKDVQGNPLRAFVDWQLNQPVVTFYPIYNATTGFVLVGSDSYICIKTHTSDSTNQPGVGADWATYWELTTIATALNAWATATAYDSGCVHFTKVSRFLDVGDARNNPDAPAQWDRALIWAIVDELSAEHGIQLSERQGFERRAIATLAKARAGNKEDADLTISPDFGNYG